MGCVLDANIVKGVFEEDVHGTHDLTDSPVSVLRRIIASGERICIDDGDVMQAEWANCVEREWFENWFVTLASESNLATITPIDCRHILKRLRIDYGFPQTRDRTVLMVALTDAATEGRSRLVTEDLDFFDPKAKAQARIRQRVLSGQTAAPLAAFLKSKHKVQVQSACLCNA